MANTDGRLYEVTLEWNGDPTRGYTRRPPSKWYRYLEKLTGMSVRKNGKDALTMMDSRMNAGDYGVIIQEGCIRCGSYSLARTIFFLAKNGLWIDTKDGRELIKPDACWFTEVKDIEVEMSASDEEALALMSATFSHRGRRKGDPMLWTVSCMEDLASYELEDYHAINCPHCGGLQIRARVGEQLYFADPGGSLASAWLRTRFATGQWEVPRTGSEEPPTHIDIKDDSEKETVGIMITSTDFIDTLNGMDREDAFRAMDAAFVARLYWDEDRRTNARVQAFTSFMRVSGGMHDKVMLVENPNKFDILDAAGPIGPEWAASKLWRYLVRTGDVETGDFFEEPEIVEMSNPHKPVLTVVTP